MRIGEPLWWHRVGRFLDEWHPVELERLRSKTQAVVRHQGELVTVLRKNLLPRRVHSPGVVA